MLKNSSGHLTDRDRETKAFISMLFEKYFRVNSLQFLDYSRYTHEDEDEETVERDQ